MWIRTHRNHLIMAFPSFNTAMRNWRVQADISWCRGKLRESAFVQYPIYAATEAEAVSCALRQSVEWIDGRISRNKLAQRSGK